MAAGRAAGAGTDSFSPLAAIRKQFPGWRPFRSDGGWCWATRVGGTRPAHPPAEWAMTVDGDGPRELRAAIERQEAMEPG